MNEKITASALKQIQGKRPDETVLLTLRTNVVLTTEEIALLTAWNARLLYDNGNMVLLSIQVGKVNDIAAWPCVREIR
jgi:hypothetical protein